MKIGRLSEPYETGGGDPVAYADYAKSFTDACNRMLAKVSGLPKFNILKADDIDLGKFYWALAQITYSYEEIT